MGKTSSYLVIFAGLLLMVVAIAATLKVVNRNSSPTLRQSEPTSSRSLISAVLKSHGGGSNRDWTRFSQKGTQTYYVRLSNESRQFERTLTLATDGPTVRYDRATLDINQRYVFDGKSLVRTTLQPGTQPEVRPMDGVEASSIKFQIATFGLLPVLKRLSNPGTKVFYVGATSKGDRFEVKTVNGSWYFYANSNHVIDRLEVGEIHITYGDYRKVAGLILPFKQYVSKGETFLYEIDFDTFVLNPVFESGYFRS